MTNSKTYKPYNKMSASDFSREIQAGVNRAPEERAKAVRDFWNWLTRH